MYMPSLGGKGGGYGKGGGKGGGKGMGTAVVLSEAAEGRLSAVALWRRGGGMGHG